jgi:hypothetical protein
MIQKPFAYLTANRCGNIRKEELHGRPHYVVPVSMIVPGVLNGSRGSLLYPPEEIVKNHSAWNGMPLVVYHPFRDGKAISARDPGVLNARGIGTVLNSRVTEKGILAAEAWIDIERCRKIDSRIISAIERGEQVELSTGLFTRNDPAPAGATFNGKPYDKIARRYVPDHLAILPDEVGACSISDGCGLGVTANANEKPKPNNNDDFPTYNWSPESRKAAMLARHHGGAALKAGARAVGHQLKSSAKNLIDRLKKKIGLGKKPAAKPPQRPTARSSMKPKTGKGKVKTSSKQRSVDRLKKLQAKLKAHRDAKTAKTQKEKVKKTVRAAKKTKASSKSTSKRSATQDLIAKKKGFKDHADRKAFEKSSKNQDRKEAMAKKKSAGAKASKDRKTARASKLPAKDTRTPAERVKSLVAKVKKAHESGDKKTARKLLTGRGKY